MARSAPARLLIPPSATVLKSAIEAGDFKQAALLFATRKPPPSSFPSSVPPNHDGTTTNDSFSFLPHSDQQGLSLTVDAILQSFLKIRSPNPAPALRSLLVHLLSSPNPASLPLSLATIQCMIRTDSLARHQPLPSLSDAWIRQRTDGDTPIELFNSMRRHGYRPDGNTLNFLLRSLCSSDWISEARLVVGSMGQVANSESYHLMIAAARRSGDVRTSVTLLEEMVVDRGMVPMPKTVTAVLEALRESGDCLTAVGVVKFLTGKRCEVLGFHNYELVVETCLERKELVLAGKMVMEMMRKGFIPFIGVRMRVCDGLASVGQRALAWEIRRRCMTM